MIDALAKTGAQIRSQTVDPRLPREYSPLTYQDVKLLKRHPTIAMCRRLVQAPIMASSWSFEATVDAPEEAQAFIDAEFQRWRTTVLRAATQADVDYGWLAFEVVPRVTPDGRNGIGLFKPLLQQLTEVLIDPSTGAFVGVLQKNALGFDVVVTAEESLLLTFQLEGTYWYGSPRLEAAKNAHDDWRSIAAANDRYDRKVAGSSWIIHYPVGRSDYNGQEKDNYEVALDLLDKLQASGAVVVPKTLQETVDSLSADSPRAWTIELKSDGVSPQYSFVHRMKYLDALMARALGLPERAILEGEFGTKAEAGEHADFAITDIENTHAYICEELNRGPIDQTLERNWGPEARGTVRCVPSPISDARRKHLRALYERLLTSQEVLAEESLRVDMDALRDQLGIPFNAEAEDDELA